jgi:hypothetical protein
MRGATLPKQQQPLWHQVQQLLMAGQQSGAARVLVTLLHMWRWQAADSRHDAASPVQGLAVVNQTYMSSCDCAHTATMAAHMLIGSCLAAVEGRICRRAVGGLCHCVVWGRQVEVWSTKPNPCDGRILSDF